MKTKEKAKAVAEGKLKPKGEPKKEKTVKRSKNTERWVPSDKDIMGLKREFDLEVNPIANGSSLFYRGTRIIKISGNSIIKIGAEDTKKRLEIADLDDLRDAIETATKEVDKARPVAKLKPKKAEPEEEPAPPRKKKHHKKH